LYFVDANIVDDDNNVVDARNDDCCVGDDLVH
jgi:hypothetical protein